MGEEVFPDGFKAKDGLTWGETKNNKVHSRKGGRGMGMKKEH